MAYWVTICVVAFLIAYGMVSLIDDINEKIELDEKIIQTNEELIKVYSEFNEITKGESNGNR